MERYLPADWTQERRSVWEKAQEAIRRNANLDMVRFVQRLETPVKPTWGCERKALMQNIKASEVRKVYFRVGISDNMSVRVVAQVIDVDRDDTFYVDEMGSLWEQDYAKR